MARYKPLHLAFNVDALDLLARKDLNFKNLTFRSFCNSLGKVYEASLQDLMDQEKTYVLLVRYLMLYEALQKQQRDKAFVNSRFGAEHKKIYARYLELKEGLRYRYYREIYRPFDPPDMEVDLLSSDSDVEIIEDPPIFSSEFITSRVLVSALNRKCKILLVDARPASAFGESRFNYDNTINVPEEIIQSGLSANVLGENLPPVSKPIWDRRDCFDAVVLFDWNTTSENLALSKLNKLYIALVQWDVNRHYKEKPVILNGGYLELLQSYPTMCSNPSVLLASKNDELDDLLQLEGIDYPAEADNLTHDDANLQELVKENKEILATRTNVITKLIEEENEWKEINAKAKEEKDITKLFILQDRESKLQTEISQLENNLARLNEKRDELRKKLERSDIRDEGVENDMEVDDDDSDKMRILGVISEERVKALNQARALKPKNDGNANRARRAEIPVVNRANKPGTSCTFSQPLARFGNGLIGLSNIRNTCYMNTVIQCLAHLPFVINLFCLGGARNEVIRSPAALANETANLIRLIWSAESGIEPIEFYRKVCSLQSLYKEGNHEDCMEFFMFLLNHLTEDFACDINGPLTMTPRQKAWYGNFDGKTSLIADGFFHQIRVVQNCPACGLKTYKFEMESTFMVRVPETDFDLGELMDEYMDDFMLPTYRCAKCGTPVNNTKEFCHQPKVLVIVLKRYKQITSRGSVGFQKIESRSHFKLKNFQVGRLSYNLIGIAMHSGGIDCGHYSAGCLTKEGWYEFNDLTVRPLDIKNDAVKVKACAFFYSIL